VGEPESTSKEWADSEITRITRSKPRPDSSRRRRPARVRLNYRDFEVFVAEYRENLRRGGTFIRTEKPLPVGRECLFEIGAPGLDEPLVFPAVVTFVATAAPGQEAGMGVEYRLEGPDRSAIERVLNRG
jgi:type IV pilus assembly protein PilZ